MLLILTYEGHSILVLGISGNINSVVLELVRCVSVEGSEAKMSPPRPRADTLILTIPSLRDCFESTIVSPGQAVMHV